MLKHRDMMKQINTGLPFDCLYCKSVGVITPFVQIKKHEKTDEPKAVQPATATRTDYKRRVANQYESLVPFVMQNGEIRELYTRAIVSFNNEEVIL